MFETDKEREREKERVHTIEILPRKMQLIIVLLCIVHSNMDPLLCLYMYKPVKIEINAL